MNLQEQKEANLNSLRDRIRQKALQRLQQKETPSLMQNGVDTSEIRDVNEIWGDCRNINGTLKVDGDKIYAEKKSSDIEVLNDTALSDVDTTADKRMRVGDFVDSEANKKAAPLNMSASGEANALSSIRNDADPLNGYANVNSSLLENNIVLPLGDSSQQVASTGIDYTDLISQFKNLSNPIILAFLNNDTSSIFHPTNLIPDKKDTSKNGLATNLKNALITNMWKPRSRAGAENTGDIISTPTNSIKAAPTPTYTKTSPPTPTNTIGASSVSTHTNKAPINTIGAYSTPASVPSKPNFASTNTVTPTISDQVQPAQTTKAIYSKNTTKAPPNKWVNFQAASSSTWINPQTASNSRPTIQGSITSGVSSQPTSLNNSVKPSNITDMAVPPSTSSLLYQESQSTLKAASQTISTRGYNAAMQPQTTFINNTMPTAAIPHNNINFKISTPAISSEYVSRVSKGGMTLISKNIYERDEAKFKALKANIQAEKAKLSQMKKEQQKKTNEVKKVQALQLRIGKNQTRYDYCDRIQIGSDKHSVVSQGAKLLLLTSTPGEKEKNLLWGGRNYIRANSGNYKTKKKYVYNY